MREVASWEEGRDLGYDEGHEYCVNEREVNHSDQTIKTMLTMVWRASFPLHNLRDFPYTACVSDFLRSMSLNRETWKISCSYMKIFFCKLARYKSN